MTRSPEASSGAAELQIALRLALAAWLVMGAQELLLFLRPTPFGGAYVQAWVGYFGRALFYNLLGVALVTLPFLARWLAGYRRTAGQHPRRWHVVQLVLLTLTIGLDQADNEVMRFLGTHLTVTLLRTYERVQAWGSDMLHVFPTDRGGPWLPFVLLFGGMAFFYWWGRRVIEGNRDRLRPWPFPAALAAAGLPVIVPLIVYLLPGGHFPRNRVRPEVITLWLELLRNSRSSAPPADFSQRLADYRALWAAGDGSHAWQFDSSGRYPLIRVPLAASPDTVRRNVIFLQLETFRGWDMGFLRPDRHPSPTPFLDRLAADSGTAYWTRFLSFGPPTINGFMAGHCSVPPHSEWNISTTYTGVSLQCFPAVLRRHGWHTAYFTGSDPDWDNQTIWLRRWYDEVRYYPDTHERDREIFRRALARIRELGRSPAPFLATVVSISNHYPFRSRETALDLGPATTPAQAVLNTTHYTDDVVREFVDSLASEPWYPRTLLVIVGDHGFNLGEHDGTPGQPNGWRESIWVPFLIHSSDLPLRPGAHTEVASQLDVGPTVADLVGIRDTTPWLGRSLLTPPGRGAQVGLVRGNVLFAETPEWSLVLDPATSTPRLYAALQDPLQRTDLASKFPAVARQLERQVRDQQGLWNYLVESDRVWLPNRGVPVAGKIP